MTVLDLIIRLQQLPADMEVRLDLTRDEMGVFMFGAINYADEIETDIDGKFIVLSTNDLEAVEEDDDSFDPRLN